MVISFTAISIVCELSRAFPASLTTHVVPKRKLVQGQWERHLVSDVESQDDRNSVAGSDPLLLFDYYYMLNWRVMKSGEIFGSYIPQQLHVFELG